MVSRIPKSSLAVAVHCTSSALIVHIGNPGVLKISLHYFQKTGLTNADRIQIDWAQHPDKYK